MGVKIYLSGISGNKEVKKKQQRVQMILDSKLISYEAIDITEPGREKDKETMQQKGKVREALGKHPLPPQIFNEDEYCGDYEEFDLANEIDQLEAFLHLPLPSKLISDEPLAADKVNGSREDPEGVQNGEKRTDVLQMNNGVELSPLNGDGEIRGTTAASQENDDEEVEGAVAEEAIPADELPADSAAENAPDQTPAPDENQTSETERSEPEDEETASNQPEETEAATEEE